MNKFVVGVDGSEGSAAALAWALRAAARCGAEVEAVYAWELSYAWIDGYFPDLERWLGEAERAAGAALDAAVDGCLSPEFAGVGVTRRVRQGQAATVLLHEAEGADLLVVGSRGRGELASLVLGSVSHQCAQHAEVPVVLVPKPPGMGHGSRRETKPARSAQGAE